MGTWSTRYALVVCCLLSVSFMSTYWYNADMKLYLEQGQVNSSGVYHDQPDKNRQTTSTWSIPSITVPKYTYFALLVLQAGLQPILVKLCLPETIVRSTAVLGQEFVKGIISISYLVMSGRWEEDTKGWTYQSALYAAGVPASIYVLQNYCNLMANQELPPVTFSVLNQTKTLWAAVCCFLFVGQKQSRLQIVALVMLVVATLVLEKVIPVCPANDPEPPEKSVEVPEGDKEESEERVSRDDDQDEEEGDQTRKDEVKRFLARGVSAALFASFLSGLAGTLTQKTLQTHKRSPHLFNTELAVFSSLTLLISLAAGSPDAKRIAKGGVTQGWTWKSWIPIATNACGGIFVGLVTKYQGVVVKGFAMIFAMAVSAVSQQIWFGKEGGGVTREQLLGAVMGAISLYLHVSNPPR